MRHHAPAGAAHYQHTSSKEIHTSAQPEQRLKSDSSRAPQPDIRCHHCARSKFGAFILFIAISFSSSTKYKHTAQTVKQPSPPAAHQRSVSYRGASSRSPQKHAIRIPAARSLGSCSSAINNLVNGIEQESLGDRQAASALLTGECYLLTPILSRALLWALSHQPASVHRNRRPT